MTYTNFLQAHVLDPTVPENAGYRGWSKGQWLEWIERRGGGLLGKFKNSVIIGTPSEIIESLNTGPRIPYGGKCPDCRWSNGRFPIYLFVKSNGGHPTIYNCGDLYFAAAMDSEGRPTHFAAQYTSQLEGANANLSLSGLPRIE